MVPGLVGCSKRSRNVDEDVDDFTEDLFAATSDEEWRRIVANAKPKAKARATAKALIIIRQQQKQELTAQRQELNAEELANELWLNAHQQKKLKPKQPDHPPPNWQPKLAIGESRPRPDLAVNEDVQLIPSPIVSSSSSEVFAIGERRPPPRQS